MKSRRALFSLEGSFIPTEKKSMANQNTLGELKALISGSVGCEAVAGNEL